MVGTFALLDVENRRLTVVDRTCAETRAVPASTFKIAHSLIALETGAVRNIDEVVPYGGQPQPVPAWERDMSMREALPISSIAIYQELARRSGPEREHAWLERLDYGNRAIGPVIDRYWLDGPLAISPVEQTRFLQRLAQRTLPVTPAIQDTVADLPKVNSESDAAATVSGKTGWRFASDPQLGWWVGWVQRADGKLYTFALNMDMSGAEQAGLRVPIGRELL